MSSDGRVTVVFSTFDAVDHHGDVTRPGAFGRQTAAISLFNHGSWGPAGLVIGTAKVYEVGNEGRADLIFNLETQAGRETYAAVKHDLAHPPATLEWSYGFDVLDSEPGEVDGQRVRVLKRLKVYEVSPVLLGAGIGTRSLSSLRSVPTDDTAFLEQVRHELLLEEARDLRKVRGEVQRIADAIVLDEAREALGEVA